MTYLAFVLYPIAAWFIFLRLPMSVAIPTSLVFGFLTLPASFSINPPFLPHLSKDTMPTFVTLAMCLVFLPKPRTHDRVAQNHAKTAKVPATILDGWIPRLGWVRVLLVLSVIAPIFTFLFNREPVVYPTFAAPALGPLDAANMIQSAIIGMMALFIGRRFLADEAGHRAILLVLAVSGLIYSLPTLAEIRLSPQLHNIVYGYFPNAWLQHVREDGFRPLVFMHHALVLSLFLCLSALSIVAYMRAIDGDRRILYFLAALYMTVVIYLSKSLGMVLVSLTLIPVLMFASARVQMIVAAAIVALVLTYPALRIAGVNPFMVVVELVEPFQPERAGSLRYRLEAEDQALDRLAQKPLFGWGGWGRSEVRTELGYLVSARDGHWLITIVQSGAIGYLTIYGLLCIPPILLMARQRRLDVTIATSGLCIVVAANAIDLIPNAGITPITWLIVGALVGRVELGAATRTRDRAAALAKPGSPGVAVPGGGPAAGAGLLALRRGPQSVGRGAAKQPGVPLVARLRRRKGTVEADRKGVEPDSTLAPDNPSRAPRSGGEGPVYSRYAPRHVRNPGGAR